MENGVDSALYVLHDTREEEYYDLKTDPYRQMDSSVDAHPNEVNRLNQRMKTLAACRGASCAQRTRYLNWVMRFSMVFTTSGLNLRRVFVSPGSASMS